MTLATEIKNLRAELQQSKKVMTNHETTIATLSSTQKELQEKNEKLELENARLRRIAFGNKSERAKKPDDPNQHHLFEAEIKEELEPEEKPEPEKPKKKAARKKVPTHFETKEVILEAPAERKVDFQGRPLALLGYEVSERLDYQSGKHIRLIIKREKWGYLDSRDVVHTAEPLQAIVPKGKLTDNFLLLIIFQKFFMGLPLYRQLQEHNSKGAELARSTLSDGVRHFGNFFAPVYDAIKREVFSSRFIHADETPIKCQKLKNGKMKKGYFWAFRSRSSCYFHFGKTRSQEELRKVFDTSTGPPGCKKSFTLYKDDATLKLLTDGYAAYESFFRDKDITLMACWAHVRRKFYELQEANEDAPKILSRINRLYKFERQVAEQASNEKWSLEKLYEERGKMRQEKSAELVDKIEEQVMALTLAGKYTPANPMSQALSYTEKLFDKLKVFLTDGELPIDNNAAERAIKPVVIGRKNYLFVGSEDAGKSAAIAYSLIESCRQANLDPAKYLEVATRKLHQGEAPENLTPAKLRVELTAKLV